MNGLKLIPIVTFLLQLTVLANQPIFSSSTNESWSENRFWCPPGCVCSTPAQIIDCSSRGIANIPNVPRITTRLYLHDNNIHTLASHQFKSLRHLTYLILASNEIREVQPEAFSGLHSLKYLILDSNNITLLPRGVFRGLKHLETVQRERGEYCKVNFDHNGWIWSLAKNHLEVLPEGLFPRSKQLTMINLQGNKLHTVQPGAFSGLQGLHMLSLEDNLLDQRIFQELSETKQLATLRLNGNRIMVLPKDGLDFPVLRSLSLHSNNITELPAHLLGSCSSLESLSLSNNNLTTLTSDVLSGCTSLKKLELGSNQLAEIHPDVFQDLMKLTNLFLQKNYLTSLPAGVFRNLCSVKGIYLSNNRLKAIPPGVFAELPALVTIHLEWNDLPAIEEAAFTNMTRLETIFLHHNNITDIQPGAFIGLPYLKYLVLYENSITFLKQGVLNSLNSLQKVHMDPMLCSCRLAPLSSWMKWHHVRGLMCVGKEGTVISVANLEEECRTPSIVNQVPLKAMPSPTHITTSGNVQDTGEITSEIPDPVQQLVGEPDAHGSFYPPAPMSFHNIVEHLQLLVSELQFRVSRLESALTDSQVCQRWVCLHKDMRLELGDRWREGEEICSCTQNGVMECSAVNCTSGQVNC